MNIHGGERRSRELTDKDAFPRCYFAPKLQIGVSSGDRRAGTEGFGRALCRPRRDPGRWGHGDLRLGRRCGGRRRGGGRREPITGCRQLARISHSLDKRVDRRAAHGKTVGVEELSDGPGTAPTIYQNRDHLRMFAQLASPMERGEPLGLAYERRIDHGQMWHTNPDKARRE